MTCRCKKACSAVETAAEEALEQGSNAFTDAVNYITPRAKQAGQQAYDFVAPRAKDAAQHTYDYAKDAAQRASEGVSPFIQDARDRIVPLVSEAAERMQPTLEHAYETAKERVEHDVYPVFQDLWTDANENPTVQEASRRGRSAVAALRGDLLLPEPKPVPAKRGGGLLGKILAVLGIAALVGVVVIAIRAVLGSDDDGWSPAEPMRPGHERRRGRLGRQPVRERFGRGHQPPGVGRRGRGGHGLRGWPAQSGRAVRGRRVCAAGRAGLRRRRLRRFRAAGRLHHQGQ